MLSSMNKEMFRFPCTGNYLSTLAGGMMGWGGGESNTFVKKIDVVGFDRILQLTYISCSFI